MPEPRMSSNSRLFLSSRDVLRQLQMEDMGGKEEKEVVMKNTKQSADGTTETEVVSVKQTRRQTMVDSKQEAELRAHQERIIWRDFTFMVAAFILASIMGYIETHSGDVEMRGGRIEDVSENGIMDTGFFLTTPLHDYLEENRWINDLLAGINTIVGVVGPMIYMMYQTLWVGDYEVVFRYLALSAIRSFCGFATFLPPDKSYLVSYFDFPDIVQCMLRDCGDPRDAKVQPFVSFFSGHVATLVVNANHMYINGFENLGIFFHVFNVFQIIRLLATRGHYSIDIVIGWYMAVHVSHPAGRLGRHFSRGDKSMEELFETMKDQSTFEGMTGIAYLKTERRFSTFIRDPRVKESFDAVKDSENELIQETAARMALEGKLQTSRHGNDSDTKKTK